MVRALLRDERACRVCHLLRDTEHRYIDRLVAFVGEPEGREAYAHSQGVCLHHLALVAAKSDRDRAAFMLTGAARRFEEIAQEMRAFTMKTDAVRRALLNEDEADAYWRAITHIAGAKDMSMPWLHDGEV